MYVLFVFFIFLNASSFHVFFLHFEQKAPLDRHLVFIANFLKYHPAVFQCSSLIFTLEPKDIESTSSFT